MPGGGSKKGVERGGRFVKGQSGNPGGRVDCSYVRKLAQKHTDDAIQTIAIIMNDEKCPKQIRLAAANSLLDRAYGRPRQEHALSAGDDLPFSGNLEIKFISSNAD